MSSTIYQYRTLARVLITAESPIRIGSGEKDLVTDSLVIRDSNGLPYIPGSTLAGVIRSLIQTIWQNGSDLQKETMAMAPKY